MTAKQLGIHRSTLIDRVETITSLTGRDPGHGDAAVPLRLALWLKKIQDQVASVCRSQPHRVHDRDLSP